MFVWSVAMILSQMSVPGSSAWKERNDPDSLDLPACVFASPARKFRSLADLPTQVRTEIQRAFRSSGGLADTGGAFNSTDVIKDPKVPRFRFIRAYLTADTWFIWWEAGGIVRTHNTLALTRWKEAGVVSEYHAAPGSVFSGDLCAGSKAFLAGARAVSEF